MLRKLWAIFTNSFKCHNNTPTTQASIDFTVIRVIIKDTTFKYYENVLYKDNWGKVS